MKPDETRLPGWKEPSDIDEARLAILSLGRSMHEHAYLVGRHLRWVKAKVGHGNFLAWVQSNVGMSERAVRYWMAFANRCDVEGRLLPAVLPKPARIADLPPGLPPSAATSVKEYVIALAIFTKAAQVAYRAAKRKEFDLESVRFLQVKHGALRRFLSAVERKYPEMASLREEHGGLWDLLMALEREYAIPPRKVAMPAAAEATEEVRVGACS